MFAAAATPKVWQALGANGYVTVSGYDLAPALAGTPSTPAAYRAQLDAVLATIAPLADANNGSFVVGIPAAASCHEFERYSFANGTVVQGHPQQQYLEAVLQAISDAKLHSNARFLGTALWGFASKMAYPPQSDNTFTPGTPFVDKGEEDFLQTYILSLRGSVPLGDTGGCGGSRILAGDGSGGNGGDLRDGGNEAQGSKAGPQSV